MDTQPLALPVDYYELLNLAPAHLFPAPGPGRSRPVPGRPGLRLPAPEPAPDERLDPLAVDEAAARAEQAAATDPRLSPGARALRLAEIEIGRRILRDPERRRAYDGLRGAGGHRDRLRRLRELQVQVRDELAREGGAPRPPDDGEAALAEGTAALRRGDYPAARDALRRAAELLPASAAAQLAYVRAALAAADPLSLGAFALRGLAGALARAEAAEPNTPAAAALRRLVAGLLAREGGDLYTARRELEEATHLQPNLAPAWRGLAAVSLAEGRHADAVEAAQRAFAADEREEAPLHILIVAARRIGRAELADAAARRIAAMRGPPWTAERVLREHS